MVEIRKLGNSNIRIFSHVPLIIGNHNVVHSRLNVGQNLGTIFKNSPKIGKFSYRRFLKLCVRVTTRSKILVDDGVSFKIYLMWVVYKSLKTVRTWLWRHSRSASSKINILIFGLRMWILSLLTENDVIVKFGLFFSFYILLTWVTKSRYNRIKVRIKFYQRGGGCHNYEISSKLKSSTLVKSYKVLVWWHNYLSIPWHVRIEHAHP